MALSFDRSAALIAQNAKFVAGGVNSNFRMGMAGGPLVFERGDGPYLIDADGNRLIDYYCGMGAMVLGHTPAVRAAGGEGRRSTRAFSMPASRKWNSKPRASCASAFRQRRAHPLRLFGFGSGAGGFSPGARRHAASPSS